MNIPNTLSLFRLVLVPVYLWVFFSELPNASMIAAAIFVLAGITDIVDGYLARKLNQCTMLGRILDPLADKLMVWTALISLTIRRIIPGFICMIYFIKEIFMGLGGLVIYRKIKDVPASNIWGKASTVLFYAAIVASVLFDLPAPALGLLFGTALLGMLVALILYARRGIHILKENKIK